MSYFSRIVRYKMQNSRITPKSNTKAVSTRTQRAIHGSGGHVTPTKIGETNPSSPTTTRFDVLALKLTISGFLHLRNFQSQKKLKTSRSRF